MKWEKSALQKRNRILNKWRNLQGRRGGPPSAEKVLKEPGVVGEESPMILQFDGRSECKICGQEKGKQISPLTTGGGKVELLTLSSSEGGSVTIRS